MEKGNYRQILSAKLSLSKIKTEKLLICFDQIRGVSFEAIVYKLLAEKDKTDKETDVKNASLIFL